MNEMTLEEIYVLNRALDGRDIFGLPSFREIGGSEMMIHSVKEQLIRKGLLESESSFTMKGVQAVKHMEDYKNAQKYIQLGSLFIGIKKDQDTAISLVRRGIPQEFEFQALNTGDSFTQLCAIYPFLSQKTKEPEAANEYEMKYEELIEFYGLTIDNTLYLATYTAEGEGLTDEIFFPAEDRVCLYDRKTDTVTRPFTGTEKIIQERMA